MNIINLYGQKTAKFVYCVYHGGIAAVCHVKDFNTVIFAVCSQLLLYKSHQTVFSVVVSLKMVNAVVVVIHLQQAEFSGAEVLSIADFAVVDNRPADGRA